MRYRFTFGLLAINVILYACIYLELQDFFKPDLEKESAVAVHVDAIEQLEIEAETLPAKRVLVKCRDHWELKKPMVWRANPFAVRRILNQLHLLRKEVFFPLDEVLASGQSLADFGLDKPFLRLQYTEGGHAKTLAFGRSTQMGGRIYLLDNQLRHVLVANKELAESLVADLNSIIEVNVFAIPAFEIRSFLVKTEAANLTVSVEKKPEGWVLATPVQVRADPDNIQRLLTYFSELKASQFDEMKGTDLSAFGLMTPAFRITLQGQGRQQTLLVGGAVKQEERKRYALLEGVPTVFQLEESAIEILKDVHNFLRSRKIFNLEPTAITSVEVSAANKGVAMQKLENGSWKVMARGAGKDEASLVGDTSIIENLLKTLSGLEVARFKTDAPSAADLEGFGFNDPRRIVHLVGNDLDETLLITGNDAKNLLAKTKDQPFVYEIPRSALLALRVDALFYQDRKWQSIPESAKIHSLTLLEIATGKPIWEVKPENVQDWAKSSFPEDVRGPLRYLLDEVKHCEVMEYLPAPYSDPLVLEDRDRISWAYRLVVEYSLPGDKDLAVQRQTYVFSKRLGGSSQIGAIADTGPVFYLKQEWIDALHTLLYKGVTSETLPVLQKN